MLNSRAACLLCRLRARYRDAATFRARLVAHLLRHYNPDMECNPGDASDTTFTVRKGAILAICLRARRGLPRFHDMETFAFVLVHEMAHVAARMVGYPPAFWRIFKFLLLEAQAVGVLRGRLRAYVQCLQTGGCGGLAPIKRNETRHSQGRGPQHPKRTSSPFFCCALG